MATLEAIMTKVTGMSPTSTGAFKELREKRDAIKAKMSCALIELRNMQVGSSSQTAQKPEHFILWAVYVCA
jgi:hypothetical protein